MLTRKEKLWINPFIEQKYREHRRKVQNARSVIDVNRPPNQPHVLVKLTKLQREQERIQEIEKENQRLLWKLTQIMNTNRLQNFWTESPPNFLNRVFLRSNKTRHRAKSAPAPKVKSDDETEKQKQLAAKKGRSSTRCSTCSGKPHKTNQVIPEERVPWQPPKRSWNQKMSQENEKYQFCKICGKV